MHTRYELARQNLDERSAVREASNVDLRFEQFQPDDLVLVHQPHNAQDDPNNRLLSTWRGSYQVRVSKIDQSNETSVHLGRMKPYHQRSAFVYPDFEKINQMFLGAQLSMPHLEKEASQVCIGPRTVESIVDHKR